MLVDHAVVAERERAASFGPNLSKAAVVDDFRGKDIHRPAVLSQHSPGIAEEAVRKNDRTTKTDRFDRATVADDGIFKFDRAVAGGVDLAAVQIMNGGVVERDQAAVLAENCARVKHPGVIAKPNN